MNLKSNRPNIRQAVSESAENLAVEADFSRLCESLLEDLPQPNCRALCFVFFFTIALTEWHIAVFLPSFNDVINFNFVHSYCKVAYYYHVCIRKSQKVF